MRRVDAAGAAALVIGLDSITGLQTARVLADQGIPVVGVGRDRRHPSCRTNACERIVYGETQGEDLIELLASLAPMFTRPAVLFPCTDLSVLAIVRHKSRLADLYRAVLPSPEVIEVLVDKAKFHQHAVAAGLSVPRGWVVTDHASAQAAARALAFPCVLKPAVKTLAWQSATSAKVLPVSGPEELIATFARFRPHCETFLAQEWVDGPDTDLFTCNAYFDGTSRAVLAFVSQKMRQWPLTGGVGCLSRAVENEAVRRETERVFGGLGHHGLAYLEMKVDSRTGRQVIIEPNVGRPTGRSAAADRVGIGLLAAQYRDALGLPLPAPSPRSERGGKWIYLRQDCQSAFTHWRRGELTAGGWIESLRDCRHDAVWAWRDPVPFAADLARAARKALSRPSPAAAARVTVDHDVHGFVGVRVLDATPEEAALVARQIGPARGRLTREPDIVVRFVDELPADGLRWVELGRTAFTDEGFFVLNSGKRPSRVRVSFGEGTGRCELVCLRGVRKIPHLIGLVTHCALRHGYAPLHASAFRYRGLGVLVTGWAKGGKTEALLAFAAQGAEYIGDEWILLAPGGSAAFGLPEHIRLQDWHLRRLPHLAGRVSLSRRTFFRTVRAIDRMVSAVPSAMRRLPPLSWLNEALPALRRQLNVQLDPLEVFRARASAFRGPVDRVFLMVSDLGRTVRVERADPVEIAGRMAASVAYEQLPLQAAYLASRFAFPDRRVRSLEDGEQLQANLIREALSGKEAYIVRHPYPVDLESLYRAMAPFCNGGDPVEEPEEEAVRGRVRGVIHAGERPE
jgi:D-aspartate ligase